jgi:hypothetical protein
MGMDKAERDAYWESQVRALKHAGALTRPLPPHQDYRQKLDHCKAGDVTFNAGCDDDGSVAKNSFSPNILRCIDGSKRNLLRPKYFLQHYPRPAHPNSCFKNRKTSTSGRSQFEAPSAASTAPKKSRRRASVRTCSRSCSRIIKSRPPRVMLPTFSSVPLRLK